MADLIDGSIITVKEFLTQAQQHTDAYTGKPLKDFKKDLELTNKDDVVEGRAGPIYKYSIKVDDNTHREFILDTNLAQVTVGVLEVQVKNKEKEKETSKSEVVTDHKTESKKTTAAAAKK